ncbi:hypothetical protein ACH5RR_009135 [Cinchona calisaya]|uniref:RING-type E3 ubiquitin transferase n=1 Tax=Cinchona calisaya TaxID=153742 RepID=A0ABD3AE34_9GENT
MEEGQVSTYWCHACSQIVSPIFEVETIKCPVCLGGFVEEMATAGAQTNDTPLDFGGSDSDRALSLWAPILLGMMSNPRRRRRFRRLEFEDEVDDDDEDRDTVFDNHHEGESELDRELESIIRRRRRSSATILQLLQGIRAGMLSESENSEHQEGERVLLVNPFNQTIILQGSHNSNDDPQNRPFGSLGDYFVGPGLDLLLQHLAENDPNRYGTPPAQKEAVEAMPTVRIEETVQCSVCLEDFEIGAEAKEMPCKHKFHTGCILPWLELHSSCPVCRYQLPSDESKLESNESRNSSIHDDAESNNAGGGGSSNEGGEEGGRSENARRFSLPLPWPFSSLFSSSGSQSSNGNSSSETAILPDSSVNAPHRTPYTDDN